MSDDKKDREFIQNALGKFKGVGKLIEFNYYDDYRFPDGYLYELTTSKGKLVLFIDYDTYQGIKHHSERYGIMPNEITTETDDKVPIKDWVELRDRPSEEDLSGLTQEEINRKKFELHFENNDSAMLAHSDGVVRKNS